MPAVLKIGTDCYAELAVSSPVVAEIPHSSTHGSYPRSHGQCEWPEEYRDDKTCHWSPISLDAG